MAAIHWILYVHFHEFAFVINDLLPNTQRPLGRIHFFHVASFPTIASRHFIPVASTAI